MRRKSASFALGCWTIAAVAACSCGGGSSGTDRDTGADGAVPGVPDATTDAPRIEGGPATETDAASLDSALVDASPSDPSSLDAAAADAGADGATPGRMSGQLVNGAYAGIGSYTVTSGQAVGSGVGDPVMTNTNAMGFWSMPAGPPGEWLTLQFGTGSGGYDLLEIQNFKMTGSWDFGGFNLTSATGVRGMLTALPAADANGGVLLITLAPNSVAPGPGLCASAVHATVTVTGADGGTFPVAYFANGVLSPMATAVQDTSAYSAVAYNVDPETQVTVSIAHPTCHQVPWPASLTTTTGSITFAGTVQVPPAPALSFVTVWLE
jgi:hypothetical protein